MHRRSIINEGLPESGEAISAINVTPLVDVMICLLIIFMVATPMMTPSGQDVDLPPGHGKEITEEEFLYTVVSIDKRGKVFLGTLPLSDDLEQMKSEIAGNAKLKEDGMVFIQGDQNVEYQRIVDVLVALQGADIAEVGFVTDPNPQRLREGVQ